MEHRLTTSGSSGYRTSGVDWRRRDRAGPWGRLKAAVGYCGRFHREDYEKGGYWSNLTVLNTLFLQLRMPTGLISIVSAL